jgi:uncharacterized damage-inducible protein DinB
MNYYGGKEMAASFRTVRNNTIIIAEEIPEEHYGFRPTPESRSVGQTLVHIAVIPQLQEQIHAIEKRTSLAEFDFPGHFGRLIGEEQKARTKAEIIAYLRSEGDRFAGYLDGVSDEFLAERVSMPPGMTPASKCRFEMLSAPKEHEMHHRGQLMVMERLLGIVPHMTREMMARMAAMSAAKPA